MAAVEQPALDLTHLTPLSLQDCSHEDRIVEMIRRMDASLLPRVGEFVGLPGSERAAEAAAESRLNCPGYLTEGLCQYDFRSAFFNPALALYNPACRPPYPNVAPLDNISKFRSSLHPLDGNADYKSSVQVQRSLTRAADGTAIEQVDASKQRGTMFAIATGRREAGQAQRRQ